MKTNWYGILFLIIISSFIVAPTVQQYVTGTSTILIINELNEEEEKTSKEITQFRTVSPVRQEGKLSPDRFRFRYFIEPNYETPHLKQHLPPPEFC